MEILTEPAQDIDRLRHLYEVDGMTTRQIADLYGTDKTRIIRLLRKHGVTLRSAYEARYGMSREERAPTPDALRKHLGDGLTQAQIAEIYNCDYTAVRYWINRYGIEWNVTPGTLRNKRNGVIEPTCQELFALYCVDFLSLEEIGRRFNCSRQLIQTRMEQYGIALRPGGWSGKLFKCRDGHAVRSTYEQRVDDWLSAHNIEHEYEPVLPFGANRRADFLANGKYIEIWGVTHNAAYKARKEEKVAQYAEHNLPLVQISHWQFTAQKKGRWQRILERAFIHR